MLLECLECEKKYYKKVAVNGISFQVEAGKIYALLGPNGSGKTTMMKMIAGLVKPTKGGILFEGKPIGVESKEGIAYMATEPYFYNFMTVKDVGKYYKDFFHDFDMDRYENLLERMELSSSDKAKDLSSGLAAKLKIAATLARNAKLYILDEPLNGIDIIARERIVSTILDTVREDSSMILSSHLVEELEKIIDYAIYIKNGTVVLQGDAKELVMQREQSIVDIYKTIYA